MKIIEHFIMGRNGEPKLCEDGILIKENFVAVIDGVTSKGKHVWNGLSSGCIAKNIITNYLSGNVESQDPEELLNNLNTALQTRYYRDFEVLIPEEQLRACIIIYNNIKKEIWSYGDCSCIINGIFHSHKKQIDIENAKIRAKILREALESGTTVKELQNHDIGREAITARLVNQFNYENKPVKYGYPVLNGASLYMPYLIKYSIPAESELILATDGYPELFSTLKESEEYLKQVLKEDPLCTFTTKGLMRNTLSYDDRCYCKIKT